MKKTNYFRYYKRSFDFLFAIALIIFLFPILIFLAFLVKVNLGSPIFFKQARPGLNEKIFYLCKFRTMTNQIDNQGNLIAEEDRLTKFGRFLRSTSLDELPSLFNIIKGDMSLVGPRPLLIEYLHVYSEKERTRHKVRPGITGLAQISGRNSISWKEKFYFDIKYVENITFFNDLSIIFITLLKVLKKEGINKIDNTLMEKYNGKN
jgi:lipopolysaccharide/colanic/teichoic acid biosynthesis glycosyltransferase